MEINMPNIFSVDVEEIFHTQLYNSKDKGTKNFRTNENIEKIIKILDDHSTNATFFVVGEIIEQNPGIIDQITERGHEVAFHGWTHKSLSEMSELEFSDSLKQVKNYHIGFVGFRAPGFSLRQDTLWVLKILEEHGFTYDSSLFPCLTPLYGVSGAPLYPYIPSKENIFLRDEKGIIEFPLLVDSFLGIRYPVAGGFYLRVTPRLVYHSIRKRQKQGYPSIIFIHNWEIDEYSKQIENTTMGKLVSYYNIDKTVKFLTHMLKNFKFTSFRNLLEEHDIDSMIKKGT
jgi:polysaccharide deacetylase family protein (PEP-CTERM system associated)